MKTYLMRLLCLGCVLLTMAAVAASARADDLAAGRALLLAAAPVNGSVLDVSDLSGKPVIVTFFASWCPPCTDEFKSLNQVRARYGADDLAIVAVNAFEAWGGAKNPARMARFLARTKPVFPMVEADDGLLRAFGGVTRIPTLIIYDRDGREVWRFVHEVDALKRSATVEDIQSVLSGLDLR